MDDLKKGLQKTYSMKPYKVIQQSKLSYKHLRSF